MGYNFPPGWERQWATMIQKHAGTYLRDIVGVVVCTVNTVNSANRTCTCTSVSGNAQVTYLNVQLMAGSNNGFVVIPAVGSTVIIAASKRNNPFVLMYSAISEVSISIASSQQGGNPTTYDFKSGLQQFNDGSYGGLIAAKNMVGETDMGLQNQLTALNTQLQTLITLITSTAYPGLQAAAVAATFGTPDLPTADFSQIVNPLITHGK